MDELTNPLLAANEMAEILAKVAREKQDFVLRTVAEAAGLTINNSAPPPAGQGGRSPAAASTNNGITAKDFIRSKQPQTDAQRIACLAFYLTHEQLTPHFNAKDLKALNGEAGQPQFSNLSMAMQNATRQSKFLTNAAGAKKQITTHGEDVVSALPDLEKVKSLKAPRKSGRKRKKAASSK